MLWWYPQGLMISSGLRSERTLLARYRCRLLWSKVLILNVQKYLKSSLSSSTCLINLINSIFVIVHFCRKLSTTKTLSSSNWRQIHFSSYFGCFERFERIRPSQRGYYWLVWVSDSFLSVVPSHAHQFLPQSANFLQDMKLHYFHSK